MTRTLIPTEADMLDLGRQLISQFYPGDVVFFQGDLGAGKTTLIKGILQGLGYQDVVTSPTYTLLQPYSTERFEVLHFDLYRLKSPDELEMLGIRDLVDGQNLIFVEWPERGQGILPKPSVTISIQHSSSHSLEDGQIEDSQTDTNRSVSLERHN